MAYQRTEDELRELLRQQVGHLRRSNEAYDQGVLEEAQRIASVCYVLCHDGNKRTVSLLTQLKLKSSVKFVNSSLFFVQKYINNKDMYKTFVGLPLANMRFTENDAEYVPHRGEVLGGVVQCSFRDWWDDHVYGNRSGYQLTRKNLVFAMRTQDGGAHVDSHLSDGAYHLLSRVGEDRAVYKDANQVQRPIRNAHWASMRQIGWELDESLKTIGF